MVCRESVALIVWEPCGHLALCEDCHGRLEGSSRHYCVVCRSQGEPHRLLRTHEPGPYACRADMGLRVSAHGGLVEAGESGYYRQRAEELKSEKSTLGKAEFRRMKRTLSRMRKQLTTARSTNTFGRNHPWLEEVAPSADSWGASRHARWPRGAHRNREEARRWEPERVVHDAARLSDEVWNSASGTRSPLPQSVETQPPLTSPLAASRRCCSASFVSTAAATSGSTRRATPKWPSASWRRDGRPSARSVRV